MTAVNTPQAALRAVAEGTATVGVVPFPADDDADPWWRFLAPVDARSPRIVARLPFYSRGNSRGDDRDALAVLGCEATAADHLTKVRRQSIVEGKTVRLSRRSCMISVLSLYESSFRVSSSAIASSKA